MAPDPSTYLARVAVDRDVARANFALFIGTALNAARARGMNDAAIEKATGLAASTFYRWRRGDWGREWPKLQQVIDFCKGLGIPEEDAFAALGLRGERAPAAPEPLDPDMVRVLRALADPNVSKVEKDAIRLMMRRLAAIPPEAAPKPSTRPVPRHRRQRSA